MHADSKRSKVSRGCDPDNPIAIKLSLACPCGQLLALFLTANERLLTAGEEAAEGEKDEFGKYNK